MKIISSFQWHKISSWTEYDQTNQLLLGQKQQQQQLTWLFWLFLTVLTGWFSSTTVSKSVWDTIEVALPFWERKKEVNVSLCSVKKKNHPTAASCFFFRFVWFSFHFLATATVVIFSLAGEGGGANPQPHFRFFFSKRPRPWSDHHQISWWRSCDWSGSDFLLGWTAPCWASL